MQKEHYFVKAARDFGESVQDYLATAKYNYVIVEGEKPILWAREKYPVIFGSIDEVAHELNNWTMPIKNISIITEEDYIKTYLGQEVWEQFAYGSGIMDTTNGHDTGLVEDINRAWRKGKINFKPILCALYERDIDKITDHDAFRIPKWEQTEEYNEGLETENWDAYMDMALKDMQEHWEDYADNYLQHIADDGDLECILNFLHYPHLPIYKD
jgi:hypothetical protein